MYERLPYGGTENVEQELTVPIFMVPLNSLILFVSFAWILVSLPAVESVKDFVIFYQA